MEVKMSIQTRKELLLNIKKRYQGASSSNKRKILNEFTEITSYNRKYAIHLLNCNSDKIIATKKEKRVNKRKYDEAIRQALFTIWHAANQICSKRLVPFIPDLLAALERFKHLSLPDDIRSRLLNISPATVDRLLKSHRQELNKGISTTRPGSLLKKQIKVRTFADWDDVVPGFLEGDLVAHCGDRTDDSFLNTLVLTDIATGWTEFFPLLRKGEADVIDSLKVAQQLLPFLLLGLDTDNGSEFINYALLDFCKKQEITFTRSRAYKKNDQAHVEEKNGSIVRRVIGYDRYEGLGAYNALSELYALLRLYVNFFQPSVKLVSKKRDGAKVTKKYDKAKTPYQRLLCSSHISEEAKVKLTTQYNDLDPFMLLKGLEKLQDNFWKHAWKPSSLLSSSTTRINEEINTLVKPIDSMSASVYVINDNNTVKKITMGSSTENINNQNQKVKSSMDCQEENNKKILQTDDTLQVNVRLYRRTKKPRKQLGLRTWRTYPDRFKNVLSWAKDTDPLIRECGQSY